MKTNKSFLIVVVIFVVSVGCSKKMDVQDSTQPQTYDDSVSVKLRFDKSGYVCYIKFDGKNKTGEWDSPLSPEGFFRNILKAPEENKFILKSKRERDNGSYTEHYRQFYKKVEAEGGLFILHFSNGKLTKANGHYVNTAGVNVSPVLTPEDAAKSYAAYLRISDTSALKFVYGMVVAEIETNTVLNAKLCYKVNLIGTYSGNGETGYIDAHNGQVLKTVRNWDD